MRCFVDISAINRENKARYSSIIVCITFAQYCIETAPFHIASVNDPDDVLWAWQSLFVNICDEHAPWKEVKIRRRSAPSITNKIRHKINKRYKLFKAAVTKKCPESWQNYTQARNEVTAPLRKA